MSKTKVVVSPHEELSEALDRFVASRPCNARTVAIEAALADKVGRLARTLLLTPPDVAANGADGRD